jgi:hypothetical protein
VGGVIAFAVVAYALGTVVVARLGPSATGPVTAAT